MIIVVKSCCPISEAASAGTDMVPLAIAKQLERLIQQVQAHPYIPASMAKMVEAELAKISQGGEP